MGIISDIELVVSLLEELLPTIDALPLSPELSKIRANLEKVLSILKVVA